MFKSFWATNTCTKPSKPSLSGRTLPLDIAYFTFIVYFILYCGRATTSSKLLVQNFFCCLGDKEMISQNCEWGIGSPPPLWGGVGPNAFFGHRWDLGDFPPFFRGFFFQEGLKLWGGAGDRRSIAEGFLPSHFFLVARIPNLSHTFYKTPDFIKSGPDYLKIR